MVDASLVLDAIVAVSIAAGAVFAVVELREMRRDRRTGLMIQFAQIWLTLEFEEVLSKLIRAKYTSGEEAEDACTSAGLQLIGDYFETMSEYVDAGLLDSDDVTTVYPVEWAWGKLEPWIKYARTTTGIEGLHGTFEWLANEARKRRLAAEH